MRGLGLFFGGARRSQPQKLENPHPVEDYGRASIESGDAGKDGFTCLSRANPDDAGHRPSIPGGARPTYWYSGESFEQ